MFMKPADQYTHFFQATRCFKEVLSETEDCAASSCYHTKGVLLRLNVAIGDLCVAILEDIPPYACAILYRALIEHVIKHAYVSLRYVMDRDDSVAERYISDGGIGEMYRAVAASVPQSSRSELKGYLEENLDISDLRKISDQFALQKILDYFDRLEVKSTRFKEALVQIRKEIPKLKAVYSELSSYVHGGSRALMQMAHEQSGPMDVRQYAIAWTVLSQFLTATFLETFVAEGTVSCGVPVQQLRVLLDRAIAAAEGTDSGVCQKEEPI